MVPHAINNNIMLGSGAPFCLKPNAISRVYQQQCVCGLRRLSDGTTLSTGSVQHHYSLLLQIQVCFGPWPQSPALLHMASEMFVIHRSSFGQMTPD